ncbi:aminotransferase class I/II-fold pyridoxal phosphate-dependent enzyme [Gaetbulibacter sp. M240]|uniref:aminotransferase class I/II-fold pyridoxal phosphate-dependent enzyme n=1 Tax=Gaetbulibacter sp. M240 TaxID=3126511 RepID=UPI00374FAAC8
MYLITMNLKYPSLSERGNALASNPARIDLELFMEANENLYHPEKNPDGAFPLNVAENQLSATEIKNKLTTIFQKQQIPDWVMVYTSALGHPEVRATIAKFMSEHLCHCPIAPENLGLAAGAAAVIETSTFLLANAGDIVVIPAPSYPMYTKDIGVKSHLERYDLQTHFDIHELGTTGPVTTTLLDKVLDELKANSKTFKILLITAPDNPTGCRYTEKQLKTLSEWCTKHHIHMVVNEIYGLSLINEQETDKEIFCSFAKIMQRAQSDYLHLWYGFSKDFAMSGIRIGVAHSLNEAFLKGLDNVNVPHMVSNLAQWGIAELLKDNTFVKSYINENKKRLFQSYTLATKTLENLEVPYVPAKGSFFIWADFSKYLKNNTDEGETQLWLDIYNNTGVLLTPGKGFQHQKKGLFRIVFTAVPYKHLDVAMARMYNYLSERRI